MATARNAIPAYESDQLITCPTTSKVIWAGDFLVFSGNFVVPTALAAGNIDNVKASAAGIAREANIQYNSHGGQITASALKIMRGGMAWVSANFSGRPKLGVHAYPATTGSAVGAPTGLTGVAAKWGTAVPVAAGLGTASGVAVVVDWRSDGNGGTGEMLIALDLPRAGYY